MLRRFIAVMLLPFVVATTTAAAFAATNVALSLPPTQSVSGQTISTLADKLAFGLVRDPDRTVVPAFHLADQAVPTGALTIATGQPMVYATYIAVPVQLSVDGRLAKTVTAGYRIDRYVHTAVAAHDLAPGTLLAQSDLTTARILANGRAAVGPASLVGRKIRAATPRGQAIFVEQTAVNELVKAGAGAILLVVDGPVQLTADVVARSSAGLGESVSVYNAATNKVLSGIVTGPNRVELDLPGGDVTQ